MADKKISELTNITGANLANADEFVVVDASADQTKAITFGELKEAFDTGTGFVRITGDTMTGDLSFGDNDKATFGAGSDLQIYHDGSNSFIADGGVGRLYVRGSSQIRLETPTGENMAIFNDNGGVSLRYNNVKKFETSSSGVDITGTLTSDGLTVDGVNLIRATNAAITDPLSVNNRLRFEDSDPTKINGQETGTIEWYTNDASNVGVQAYISVDSSNTGGGYMHFATGDGGSPLERIKIDNDGDISFYEDTGTTPKFFWDASAESLGIGTSSPSYNLEVVGNTGFNSTGTFNQFNFAANGTGTYTNLRITNSSSTAALSVGVGGSAVGAGPLRNNAYVWNTAASSLSFGTSDTNRMVIDSSGNVGIGTDNPTNELEVHSTGDTTVLVKTSGTGDADATLKLDSAASGESVVEFMHDGVSGAGIQWYTDGGPDLNIYTAAASNGQIDFQPNNSLAMRIDSSGNLLVGTTSTSLYNTTTETGILLNGTLGNVSIARSGNRPLDLNRLGTDGSIAEFRKDGTTVGSIGTFNGDAYIGNGDTGITFADGSDVILPVNASTPTYRDAAVSLGNTFVRFKDLYLSGGLRGDALTFSNLAGSEAMRITSSGSVGIGESSPSTRLHVNSGIYDSIATFESEDRYGTLRLIDSTSTASTGGVTLGVDGDALYVQTGSTRSNAMRIDSSGNLLVGTTSPTTTGVGGATFYHYPTSYGRSILALGSTTTLTGAELMWFYNPNGKVGRIETNANSTSYVTTSDYRLKTDAQPMTGASARVQALNPVNFEWLSDGSRVDGFLAHEAQEVVPEAVSGTKDAMRDEEYEVTPAVLDDDGNVVTEAVMGTRSVPDYQGIDQSKLVPLLTAALQEALTKIDALEDRITTLEG